MRRITDLSSAKISPLYRNGIALTASAFVSAVLGLGYWTLVTHRADRATVGAASAVVSALTGLSVIAQLSLGGFLITYLPRAASRAPRLVLCSYAAAGAASLVFGTAFAVAAPHISGSLAWLGTPGAIAGFAAAVLVWSIFGLQDNVLTALRQARWVPAENTAYGLSKLILLAIVGPATAGMVLLTWVVPAAVLLVPICWLLFRRLIPNHVSAANGAPDLIGWRSFLGRDVAGLLCAVAGNTLLPVLVLARLGPAAAGAFGICWMLAQTLDLISINMGMSLTAEGSYAGQRPQELLRALRRRVIAIVLAAAVAGSALAPVVLRIFGPDYATAGVPLLIALLCAGVVRSVVMLSTSAARAARHGGRVLVLQVLPAFAVPAVMWLLTGTYGLLGVGLATIAGNLVAAGYAVITETTGPLRGVSMRNWLARSIGFGRMVIAIRLLQYPVRMLIRVLERVVPQQAGLVLFGSARNQFADNTAYAYLAACRNDHGLRPVWITGSRSVTVRLTAEGLPVARRWSLHGVLLAIRAECFVVSAYRADINPFFGSRATLVNLWHGIPYKRIQRDIAAGPLAKLYRPRRPSSLVGRALGVDVDPPDVLVSPSSFVTRTCFVSAFGIDHAACWNIGYPRADHLGAATATLPSPALVRDPVRWKALAGQRVVGFFPTWRDNGGSVLDTADFDVYTLARRVRSAGAVLLFKAHCNERSTVRDADGLVVLKPDEDLHAYLGVCDLLITDYSSVALDFALTGRPVLYFTPDFDEYRRQRGFYFPPEKVLLGPALRRASDLYRAVDSWATGQLTGPRSTEVRDRFWAGYRFDAALATVRRIAALLNPPTASAPADRMPAAHDDRYASAGTK